MLNYVLISHVLICISMNRLYKLHSLLPGALSLGLKRQKHEADHSLPTSAEVKKAWILNEDVRGFLQSLQAYVKRDHNLSCPCG
jgi:hypothetical protein